MRIWKLHSEQWAKWKNQWEKQKNHLLHPSRRRPRLNFLRLLIEFLQTSKKRSIRTRYGVLPNSFVKETIRWNIQFGKKGFYRSLQLFNQYDNLINSSVYSKLIHKHDLLSVIDECIEIELETFCNKSNSQEVIH